MSVSREYNILNIFSIDRQTDKSVSEPRGQSHGFLFLAPPKYANFVLISNCTRFVSQIQIDAARVFFKGLKTAKTTATNPVAGPSAASSLPVVGGGGHHNSVGRGSGGVGDGVPSGGSGKRGVEDKLPSVYQLCVCGNGKVFMSPPDGQCAADNESLVCR